MRRWFQFSLRSLLVLMLVVAAYFGGWKSSQRKYEREMNEALRKAEEEAAEALAAAQAAQAVSVQNWTVWTSTALAPNGPIPGITLNGPGVMAINSDLGYSGSIPPKSGYPTINYGPGGGGPGPGATPVPSP